MTKSRDIADSINRIDSSAADAKAVTIDANENVGIGTSSPSKQLHQIRTGSASDLPTLAIETGFITQSTNVAASSQNISIVSGNTGEGRLFFGDTDDEDIGNIVYNHTSNFMSFDTAGTERMRILAGGGITFNGDTAAANALDDYEEGTFNPFSGVSSAFTGESTSNARYVKIGGAVHIDLRVSWTGTDNSSNAFTLTVPFSMTSQISAAHTGLVFYSGTQVFGGAAVSAHVGNTTELTFYRTDGGSFDSVRRNEVNGSYTWLVSFTYFTH